MAKSSNSVAARLYANDGNPAVVGLVDANVRRILDVGCGAGDNAALLLNADPERSIWGITASTEEAGRASRYMEACWVADLDVGLPPEASARVYDAVIFSHVLEHLREPEQIVAQACECLRPGGLCVIAVPNVLVWRQRLKFLLGRFEYEDAGIMDVTHLRFFTYATAAQHLLARAPALRVITTSVTGAVPLWLLRRHAFPPKLSAAIDALGCRLRPNLFGGEILIKAIKE